jgi:exonuclease III
MRIVTLNLNGIRSAASKGAFSRWLREQDADVDLPAGDQGAGRPAR